jgi:hypothetical protein
MTNIENVIRIYRENEDKYTFIGLRFEKKHRELGDVCEKSRHNIDRVDERDFPEYGTQEYSECFVLDGTSSWSLGETGGRISEKYFKYLEEDDRCYVIAGDWITNRDDCLDEGEIVIEDAVVVGVVI